ncbi:unannotated protein [freshwater metagenome]|uniref:Unannotated protein n=1 Tax=freshwater metagenome TaxID=449393 RepID=A0A6J7TN46_9ZZZZ
MRALTAQHSNETACRIVERGLVKTVRVLVRRGVLHPGIPIVEHDDLVEADDACGLLELERSEFGEADLLLLLAQPMERAS